jgi:hypothetical protein
LEEVGIWEEKENCVNQTNLLIQMDYQILITNHTLKQNQNSSKSVASQIEIIQSTFNTNTLFEKKLTVKENRGAKTVASIDDLLLSVNICFF